MILESVPGTPLEVCFVVGMLGIVAERARILAL